MFISCLDSKKLSSRVRGSGSFRHHNHCTLLRVPQSAAEMEARPSSVKSRTESSRRRTPPGSTGHLAGPEVMSEAEGKR